MIHFDTNALIALPVWARLRHVVMERVDRGELAAASAVAWYEFASGPLRENEAKLARSFLQGRIVTITEQHAELAAELFNATRRRRTLRFDALIAAVAIYSSAELITLNSADFEPFVPMGLRLINP